MKNLKQISYWFSCSRFLIIGGNFPAACGGVVHFLR